MPGCARCRESRMPSPPRPPAHARLHRGSVRRSEHHRAVLRARVRAFVCACMQAHTRRDLRAGRVARRGRRGAARGARSSSPHVQPPLFPFAAHGALPPPARDPAGARAPACSACRCPLRLPAGPAVRVWDAPGPGRVAPLVCLLANFLNQPPPRTPKRTHYRRPLEHFLSTENPLLIRTKRAVVE